MGSVPGDVRLALGRAGEGPEPVLALHGITAQHRAFNTAARHLRYGDGIAALDLRGRGDSEKPPSGSYGMDEHARDVIRTLDYLSIERGVLVGHSMGAFVALHAALSYPERVRALVLLDGGWPRTEEPDKEESAAVEEGLERAFRRLDMIFETPEDYLDFWFPGQNLTLEDLPPDLADYYLYDLEEYQRRGTLCLTKFLFKLAILGFGSRSATASYRVFPTSYAPVPLCLMLRSRISMRVYAG